MTVVPQSGGGVADGGGSGTLYDVLEMILDRGPVIDVFVRVSLVGIEIAKVYARVVVAGVDIYLRFAEAFNRLDLELGRKAPAQLTDLVGEVDGVTPRATAQGALTGAADRMTESLGEYAGRHTKRAMTGRNAAGPAFATASTMRSERAWGSTCTRLPPASTPCAWTGWRVWGSRRERCAPSPRTTWWRW